MSHILIPVSYLLEVAQALSGDHCDYAEVTFCPENPHEAVPSHPPSLSFAGIYKHQPFLYGDYGEIEAVPTAEFNPKSWAAE